MFVVILGIVFIERGQRRVPLRHAKRVMGRSVYEGETTYLPLKVNTAGVIRPSSRRRCSCSPARSRSSGTRRSCSGSVRHSTRGRWLYNVVYAVLIVFFAFFYTAISSSTPRTSPTT